MKRSVHAVKYNHFLLPSLPLNFTLQPHKHRLLFWAVPHSCAFARSLPFAQGGPSLPSRPGHTPTHLLRATLEATSSGSSPRLPCPPSGPTAPPRLWQLLVGNHSQSTGHVSTCTLATSWLGCLSSLLDGEHLEGEGCVLLSSVPLHQYCAWPLKAQDPFVALQRVAWTGLEGISLLGDPLDVECCRWEHRNDEQLGKAAESALAIKRKTHTVARPPWPFGGRMETAHPRRAALPPELAPFLSFCWGWPHSTCSRDRSKDTCVTPRRPNAPSSKQGPTQRIKACTWPGSDKFMKSRHPHENIVYFNLPGGNKSISSFCRRNCKSATLLRKEGSDLLKATFPSFKESRFSSQWRHLNAPSFIPFYKESWTSSFRWVYKLCYYT